MYYATTQEGATMFVGERPSWVKRQTNTNGHMVLCPENEGQGIVIDGETYHVQGRPALDYPTVSLFWQEDAKTMVEAITAGGDNQNIGVVLESVIAFTRTLFRTALPELAPEEIIRSRGLIDNWQPGKFEKASVCIDNGVIFQALANTEERPVESQKTWKALEAANSPE